jgi:hypothetical protein
MLLLMTGLMVAGLLFFIPLLKHLKTRVLPRH